MQGNHSAAWTVRGDNRLIWHRWDDEFVVYDQLSGATHLLNLLAGESLQLLEKSELCRSELAAQLALLYQVDADDAWQACVETMLVRFDRLGLIEVVDS